MLIEIFSWRIGIRGTAAVLAPVSVANEPVSRSIEMDFNGAQDFRTNDYEVDAASVGVALCAAVYAHPVRVRSVFVSAFTEISDPFRITLDAKRNKIDEKKNRVE